MFTDLLRIDYPLILADDKLERVTPTKMLGQSWRGLIWALD